MNHLKLWLRWSCRSLWLSSLGLACGQQGRSHANPPAPTSAPGHLSLSSSNITGAFALGTTKVPARGYDLWIFNHTSPALEEVPLDSGGAFRVPLSHFVEGQTYSMHLLKDFSWVGDVDVATSTPGTQAAFVYQGGLGFDLGIVPIALDTQGVPAVQSSGIAATIGGGFNVAPTSSASFDDYLLPNKVTRVAFSSQLFVFDAPTLLYSFYQQSAYPAAFATDLRRLYRLGALVLARDETEVIGVALSRTGPWQSSARVANDDQVAPEAAGLIGVLPSSLSKTSPARYEFSAFSGGMPPAAAVAVFKVQPNGGAEVSVPRRLARRLSMPPKITAVATDGSTPTTVDYTSTTSANGLTRPFCRSGEVVLDVQPPLDEVGAPIAATVFDRIEVVFDYYRNDGQKTVKVAAGPTQYAAPYSSALVDTSLADLSRSWDPAKQKLTFTLGTTVQALGTQELRLWSDLFVVTDAGKTPSAVRLRIYYLSDGEATAAATAVWFKSGC